eukprot:TRINITY_DN3115_c0_g2_i1.p2 TRINITY_DN3115_c0_g2~~TRINITY_DN3115_c0_g2_i1.p2  ORF type:complete len:316 (+),score=114.37 TRINITY_DN3115_c0_g2_i1:92-949(+)
MVKDVAGLDLSLDELIVKSGGAPMGGGGPRGGGWGGGGGGYGGRFAGGGGPPRRPGGFRDQEDDGPRSNGGGFFRSRPYNTDRFERLGGGGGRGFEPSNVVLMSELPFDWDEEDILSVLETVGQVAKLTMYWDDAGRPTGAASVEFRNPQSARRAVDDLNGAKLGTAVIRVRFQPQSGGGGGGGWGNQESRPDPEDGVMRTKREFLDKYQGRYDEWDAANPAGQRQRPPGQWDQETAVDPADGVVRSKREFKNKYGGFAEWDQARDQGAGGAGGGADAPAEEQTW